MRALLKHHFEHGNATKASFNTKTAAPEKQGKHKKWASLKPLLKNTPGE